jgi:serine/threonine-protein phosphatase PP1 catalytic subunit
MATGENVNVDAVIEQLLEVRKHPKIEKIEFKENDIRLIIHKAREIFLSQPVLLELGKIVNLNFF